jgi:hypothetical protein
MVRKDLGEGGRQREKKGRQKGPFHPCQESPIEKGNPVRVRACQGRIIPEAGASGNRPLSLLFENPALSGGNPGLSTFGKIDIEKIYVIFLELDNLFLYIDEFWCRRFTW